MSQEETIYEDNHVRITPLRFNYKSEIIPIDKIESVKTRFKVATTVFSFIVFLVSFFTFFFLDKYAYLVVFFGFIILCKAYSSYVELWITIKNSGKMKILHASLPNSQYVFTLEDKLNEAIKQGNEMQKKGTYKYTDTMKFREKLKEYE